MATRKTPAKKPTEPCATEPCAACQRRLDRDRRYPPPTHIIETEVEVFEHRRRSGPLGKLTRKQWGFRLKVGGEIITTGEGYANHDEAEERGNRLADGVYRRRLT